MAKRITNQQSDKPQHLPASFTKYQQTAALSPSKSNSADVMTFNASVSPVTPQMTPKKDELEGMADEGMEYLDYELRDNKLAGSVTNTSSATDKISISAEPNKDGRVRSTSNESE